MNRRQFLTTLAGLGLLPYAGQASGARHDIRFLSARADHQGHYFLTALDDKGQARFDVPLPGRGHGMAVHPVQDHAVAFARRPGQFLLVINMHSGEILHRLNSAEQRHFFGHGVFSTDGRWLFTTENDLDRDQGVIGVRDAADGYRQVGELPSYGIGPHELKLAADGRTLVIANGGILTRPETGRSKLNLDTMSPSLVYVDSHSGKLLAEHKLPKELHRNSIRHLAINADDTVCIGLQYQGQSYEQPLLVGMHRPGQEITLLQTPPEILGRMRNYCGSVSVDASGKVFAVSSPRGNLVTFWSSGDEGYLGHTELTDGCGVATGKAAGEFLISSGMGRIVRYRVSDKQQTPLAGADAVAARWDNHMLGLSI